MCVTPWALADGHSDLGLEKRQPDTPMNVTSVKLGQDVTSVSAEGDMDGYGKVYVTYDLSYNAARNGGTVDGQGRGFTAEGYASGRFQGFWELVDGVVVMRNVVNITDAALRVPSVLDAHGRSRCGAVPAADDPAAAGWSPSPAMAAAGVSTPDQLAGLGLEQPQSR